VNAHTTTTRRRRDALAWLRLFVCCACLLVVAWPRVAHAVGDPLRRWWTIETKHLRIHYPKRVEAIAERIARLGESIHSRLIGPYGYAPKQVTHIVLTDQTDSANGSATPIPFNTIRLFITAPSDLSPLHDYDDWYLGLLTHEYVHILHTDNISGIPALVNVLLGKTLVPNQVQPRWIIEGLATVAESRYSSGGRIRSSLFDAYLRADVLDNNIARLDQMSNNPMRWPNGTIWYLYGSRFIQWIVDIYGNDVMRAISADYGASPLPWGINRAIRRQTGRTYVQLYRGFTKHLRRSYAQQMKAVAKRGLREGRRITFHGRDVHYPKFVPAQARSTKTGYELIYYKDDANARPGHYRLQLNSHTKTPRCCGLAAAAAARWRSPATAISSLLVWYRFAASTAAPTCFGYRAASAHHAATRAIANSSRLAGAPWHPPSAALATSYLPATKAAPPPSTSEN